MDRVLQRRDTAANWSTTNPILAEGEIGIITDGAKGYKIGDGVTRWNALEYPANPTSVVGELGDSEVAVINLKGVTEEINNTNVAITKLGQKIDGGKQTLTYPSNSYTKKYYPFASGETYTITGNLSGIEYIDIYAIKEDDTIESTKLVSLQTGTTFTWTPTSNYIGIYLGIGSSQTASLDIELVNSINSDIETVVNDTNSLKETINGNPYSFTRSSLGYYRLTYSFTSNKEYTILPHGTGIEYIDLFGINVDGTIESTKIASFKVGDEYYWTPTKNYIGLYFGIASGITITIDIVLKDNIINDITRLKNSQCIYLYAYADGTTADDDTHFYGWKNNKCAWQRAIDATDGETPTKIFCKGIVDVTEASQFTYQNNGYYNIVYVPSNKSNIELIGEGEDKTAIRAILENVSDYHRYQPMEVRGDNNIVRDMAIFGKNVRYCIHLDSSGNRNDEIYSADYHKITIQNMFLKHYLNTNYDYMSPLGLGISNGMKLITENVTFEVDYNGTEPLYLHDNISYNEGFIWEIKNCRVNNTVSDTVGSSNLMKIQNLGSGTIGTIIIDNLDMGNVCPIIICENNNTTSKTNVSSYFSNIYNNIIGTSEHPIGYITKSSNSSVLRITSKSTGIDSSVRIDESSTAFEILIKGNLYSDYTEKNGVIHTNGYQYRDGVIGLEGYLMGELALDPSTIVSMQNRLGDCTTSNKSLIVVIDGISYTILFDQNYTSYSTEDMLKVFTDVIGNVATVELYNWGADYFPEISSSVIYNGSSEVILTGMGINISKGRAVKATSDDLVKAIALENILPNHSGRITFKALLSIFKEDHHHIALTTYPTSDNDKYLPAYQGSFGIGNTPGIFEKKDNGSVRVDYFGYITLNK